MKHLHILSYNILHHGLLVIQYTRYFLISNTFISNARLKFARNQAKAKQHPQAELLLFDNYSLSHPRYHPKILGDILKNMQKTSASD